MKMRGRGCLLLGLVMACHRCWSQEEAQTMTVGGDQESCLWEDDGMNCKDGKDGYQEEDPNLVPMVVDFGRGGGHTNNKEVMVYVMPDVSTFYNETPGRRRKKETNFRGQFAKFINLSNKYIRVHWIGHDNQRKYIADISPFGAAGTTAYPDHVFVVTGRKDTYTELTRWTMIPKESLYKFDPYGSIENAQTLLSTTEFELYTLQYENLAFDKVYRYKTGRQWLALYGRKQRPIFPMRPANVLGQTYQIMTNETHFISPPPPELEFEQLDLIPSPEDFNLRSQFQPYRSSESTLTLNVTVLSVAPRVFEIKNFLSAEEATHILELARGIKLSRSTTRAGSAAADSTDSSGTRTSENSWISRHRTVVVDSIYRRAADLLGINEACFRRRRPEERCRTTNSTGPVTERLQLVHYNVGQQYTPHHDFQVPDLRHGQASRFATLLLYLNEGMTGGETSFPRWLNGQTSDVLEVSPEIGKAVLFYNQLPDGNYDERSQHAAKPVKSGEKWLTNLWMWDPSYV